MSVQPSGYAFPRRSYTFLLSNEEASTLQVGFPLERDGGPYIVDRLLFSADGVSAVCHGISWEELERWRRIYRKAQREWDPD